MSTSQHLQGLRSGLVLDFPQSLGVYDRYEDAQKAVDDLYALVADRFGEEE